MNEVEYSGRLQRAGVPEHLHLGLVRYFVHHIKPGDFLTAVLRNDLSDAFARGDEASLSGLRSLMAFLQSDDVPILCWGSPRNVDRWLEALS